MEKQIIFRAIGSKVLAFEVDMTDKDEKRMAEIFKTAAASHPETLQQLFITIAEISRQADQEDDV